MKFKSLIFALSLCLCVSQAFAQNPLQDDKGTSMGLFKPIDKPNSPMGVARGIHPGRVAWAHDAKAAAWDGITGLYSDPDNNSQTRVDDLFESVIVSLTNQNDIKAAWNELFVYFNEKKGRGSRGYVKGEKIAVKVNLNDNGGTNIIDATPQSVSSLLHDLIEVVGVEESCITVYDAQRRGISAIYTYLQPLYPKVHFQHYGGYVEDVMHYSQEITDPRSMAVARAAVEADYMINMALMKRHSQPTDSWKDSAGQTGITSTGKNQFGSIAYVPPLHYSIRDWSNARGMGTYNSIVDFMADKTFGGNTLVYIVDAMYVNPKHNGKAFKFQHAPFNNGWTSSFLASLDQVAIESVVLDFINSELPLAANADNFLHEAAQIGNPASGTRYLGREQISLGVHEHWNDPEKRQYSRNLGTGGGIELYQCHPAENRTAIEKFYAVTGNSKSYANGIIASEVLKGKSVTLVWEVSNAAKVFLNGAEVEACASFCFKPKKSGTYLLEARGQDGSVKQQRVVVRVMDNLLTREASKAELDGIFVLTDDSGIECKAQEGKANEASATWSLDVKKAGNYYLVANYKGGSPVPAYVYLNGCLLTEHFGFLESKTVARDFYFPIHLEAGRSEIRFSLTGKTSNRIYSISLREELK